jgi:hypothetical protein
VKKRKSITFDLHFYEKINVMSYTKFLYHIVFRTKYGKNTIPEKYEKELYAYIMGIFLKENGMDIDERYFLKDD